MPDNPQTSTPPLGENDFFAISPKLIRPWGKGRFTLFLKQGGSYVLYTRKGEAFTASHREKLDGLGINQVYVQSGERAGYTRYLIDNLKDILDDEGISLEQRSQAWHQASVALTRKLFEERLPKGFSKRRFKEIVELLRSSVDFFAVKGALKHLASLVAPGYKLYNHSLGVTVLTAFVLGTYEHADKALITKCCAGAMLHDLGKSLLDDTVLDADPSQLTNGLLAAFRAHPSAGVGLCSSVPLEQETLNCILFHHEHCDGSGFPSGLGGEALPYYVRVLAVCNEYDGLTRASGWRSALSPYEALYRIKSHKEAFDLDALKRLILVLSNAEIKISN
ncbi:HD-GYP domain-containing protein [Desulfovibrio ferrophilus]|uniref:Metal-dependent phosphohydrolase HD sub domain protein n=1 Tax=Desulfovibrio ferrophilus TaxID=241368 RepID=A0A2Z6AZC3_9BACT|nr:HD domain-containing phosphohydrolase [Desulfovibrio ferrophilus]BBD08535.1 metal-dependent phosphohydrolase HD sub domain protein [Desulfovibrio ferrophilus]